MQSYIRSRIAIATFAGAAVTALGCSLIVEFDESRIPGEDTGVDAADTGIDTGRPDTTVTDTGMPDTTVVDTGTPDTTDTATPDTADTTPADTADTTPADTADTAIEDTADTTPADTADTATEDTADTTPTDTATEDTADATPEDTADTADTGSDTGVEDTADAADATVTLFFSTVLSGAQETPAVTTTATGDTQCTVTITTVNTLTCTLTHTATAASAAHIHGSASFGNNAGVLWTFSAGTTGATVTATLTSAELDALSAGRYYVNVHTTAHTDGELRGQLIPKGATFYAGRFVNAAGTDAGGATSGGGFGAFYTASDTKVTYYGTVTGLSGAPTDAHVHDTTGVLFGITATGTPGTTTTYQGSVTSTTFFAKAEANELYANIHTAAVGSGEARADLVKLFVAP